MVWKCSSIRELSTDLKASNCSWHVGRPYSEDQLTEVRSAVNVRLVSAVICRVVVIVFEHGRTVLPRCPHAGNSGDYIMVRFAWARADLWCGVNGSHVG